ncbi:MAG: rRNA pseudouridine synthase [Candidatus Kerfeldbacteria bacterium]|nr:rRNA pseudouridine synthase [Candidatus Kerfeldbacteria bacterium]
MKQRLQKFLASAGVASRRRAETMIAAGLVQVNGKTVTQMGVLVNPEKDKIMVRGQLVRKVTAYRYIALNKPVGYVSTRAERPGEKTVYDLVPRSRDLVMAGRLDKDSEGLVLLTNDGQLVNKLTHPRFQHPKEYVIETAQLLDDAALNKLRRGVKLEEGKAVMDSIERLPTRGYRVVLHQGWKRQIRRMVSAVRHDVVRLQRVRLAKLTLNRLRPGEWREVSRDDIVSSADGVF